MHLFLPLSLFTLTASATQPKYCPLLGPVYPSSEPFSQTLEAHTVARKIQGNLEQASRAGNLTTSVSLQIFSAEDLKSFFKFSHSSPKTTNAKYGVKKVTEDSVFRIGSNSKLFTMYLLMIKTHGDVLNQPISKYVPELKNASKEIQSNATERNYQADYTRWDLITVGELASHLAGIARDWGAGDLAALDLDEVVQLGFPRPAKDHIPPCGATSGCTKEQFFDGILKVHPQAPTSTAPLYSNAAFQILGYALEEITGKSFETVMKEELIKPLNLTRSSYSHPNMNVSVIPDDPTSSQWNADTKSLTPAGGLYSSPNDMAAIGRAILNNTLLPPAVTRRWMKPVSHVGGSLASSVGQPWEILSLTQPRVIDLYTKQGDIGNYSSIIVLSPDHNVGFTILAAGKGGTDTVSGLTDQIIEELIPVLEKSAKIQAHKRFSGSYAMKHKNTTMSMSITTDSGPGLKVSNWTFGGKDMFPVIEKLQPTMIGKLNSYSSNSLDVRLYPTGLENPGQVGFRAIIQTLSKPSGGPFTSVCKPWLSVDGSPYGGIGVDEFIFDVNCKGEVTGVSPRAFRLTTLSKKN